MPLDLDRLAGQFDRFREHRVRNEQRLAGRLTRALAALTECAPAWEDLRDKAEGVRDWLVARPREAPDRRHAPEPRPTPVTVVATDGSQVYPDRHREPHCYVLNVSRLAFQYGTEEHPIVESVPTLGFDPAAMQDALDEVLPDPTPEVVSALRDELELQALLDTARQARVEGRPIVAIADGTLIRWMLRSMRDRDQGQRFVEKYVALLEGFRAEGIPVCSYISLPGNTEVVNLLRVHAGECDVPADMETTLEGVMDRWVFEKTLLPGQRSAVFESSSRIQEQYGAADRICYFYLHVPGPPGLAGEVARVELPRWVADDATLVTLVQSVILSEADKGGGYPMILSEAHERAVIRAKEKEVFYLMMEHGLRDVGRPLAHSAKAASKRTPFA